MKCIVCGKAAERHHVKTRGSGGGDSHDNLMPLCRLDHIRWHQEGIGKMVAKYPEIRLWLESHGRTDILERAKRVGHGTKKR